MEWDVFTDTQLANIVRHSGNQYDTNPDLDTRLICIGLERHLSQRHILRWMDEMFSCSYGNVIANLGNFISDGDDMGSWDEQLLHSEKHKGHGPQEGEEKIILTGIDPNVRTKSCHIFLHWWLS